MLTDIEEEEIKRVTKSRKHRSISKQHRLNRRSSSRNTEIPRRKHRSQTKKRIDTSKLTKDEIKYYRFVNGLRKDIKIYLNKCLRESHFDPSGNRDLQINPSSRITRANETNKSLTTITTTKSLKNNETKRLTADVHTILTGPALKKFYTQFIQPREQKPPPTPRLRPLEESILWSNEQE